MKSEGDLDSFLQIMALLQLLSTILNMIQIQTSIYNGLFLNFYEIVGRNHSKNSENQSKLKKMLNSDQTLFENHGYVNMIKKISQVTDCSLTSVSENQLPQIKHGKQNSQLYFTFCPKNSKNQQQFSQQIINFRYRSHSVFKILLYSLCFNHLHLQTLSESASLNIAQQFNHNRFIVESLSQAMHYAAKREKKKSQDGQGHSLQLLLNCLHHLEPSQSQYFINNLKKIVNYLGDQLVREICIGIAHRTNSHMNKHQTIDKNLKVTHNNQNQYFFGNQQDDSDILGLLAFVLKIRIKLKNQEESVSWGNRNSKICFTISQSATAAQFYLKQIIYYKQRQVDKSQMEQVLRQSSDNTQFAEI